MRWIKELRRGAVPLCIALCFALSGCSAMQAIGTAAKAITPSGAAVDAAVQVGKENTKEGDAVLDNRSVSSKQADGELDGSAESGVLVSEVSGVSNVSSQNVQSSIQENRQEEKGTGAGVSNRDWYAESITLDQVPTIFLVLFALGWLLPGAETMYRAIGHSILFIKEKVFGIGKSNKGEANAVS